MLPSDLHGPATDASPGGPSSAAGLDFVDEVITGLLAGIEDELDAIDPDRLERGGHIQPAWFGGGDRASHLATQYDRAHRSTVLKLEEARARLVRFRDAVDLARRDVIATDEAQADLHRRNQLWADAIGWSGAAYGGGERR